MAGLVILQIEGRIDKGKVGEQAFGADPAGELEQVVVRVAGVITDAFLDFEDLNGENRRLPVTEAGFRRQHDVFHHQTAFGRGVGAVIDGTEGNLSAGAAVHGVQVVDQGLHGLIGQPVGFLQGLFPGEALGLVEQGGVETVGQQAGFFRLVAVVAADHRAQIQPFGDVLDHAVNFEGDAFRRRRGKLQGLGQVFPVFVRKRFTDAVGQREIEVRHALAAVLVVLVRLDGDAGERRVAGDVVGLAQESMAGGEAVLEQFLNVDLATGRGQGVKIKIVDMDIAILVGFGMLRLQDIHFVVDLGPFRAVFQHRTHGGVAVDIGVVPFQVAVAGIAGGDLVIGFHEAGVHFPGPGPFRPI